MRTAKALTFTATSALLVATVGAAAPAQAASTSTAAAIVYTRDAPGKTGGLVFVNPDGSDSRYFHPNGNGLSAHSAISEPALSPDGSRVAFADQASGAIWVAGVDDGTRPIQISNPHGPSVDSEPTWTPDGKQVFFTRRTQGKGQIFSAWADGSGDTSLFAPTVTDDSAPVVAPNGDIAFIRVGGSGPAGIYIWNFNILTFFVAGAGPAWSPDGTRLAYVQSSTLYVKDRFGGAPQQIGTSGLTASHPAWAADGFRIAFTGLAPNTTESRIWTVDVRTLALQQVDTDGAPGVQDLAPTWQSIAKATVGRVGGADRIDTAIDVSRLAYVASGANGRHAKAVVLSRSDTFADALGGSALAGHLDAPLLLTGTASLDSRTAAEIHRCLPPGGTVYLLGGSEALSPKVAAQAAALGYTVKRLAGPDRYTTATAIAAQVTPTPSRILVATGNNFPDALTAGAAAAATPGTVVLLSNDRSLPQSTAAYLSGHVSAATQMFGVGDQGIAALRTIYPADRVRSAAGTDRFATAAAVAHTFFTGSTAPTTIGLATGANWPDALAGGALVGANGGPHLLSDRTTIPDSEADYVRAESGAIDEVVVNGGTDVVPAAAVSTLADLTGVPGQWNTVVNPSAPVVP